LCRETTDFLGCRSTQWWKVTEGEDVELQRRQSADRTKSFQPVRRYQFRRRNHTGRGALESVAGDEDAARRKMQGDVTGCVTRRMDDAQTAEHGQFVAVTEDSINLAATDPAHGGCEQIGEAWVSERRRHRRIATDNGRFDGMDADTRRHMLEQSGKATDVIGVIVSDNDLLDVFRRPSGALERSKNTRGATRRTAVDDRDPLPEQEEDGTTDHRHLSDFRRDPGQSHTTHLIPCPL
jgi:hypothetical protein